MIICFKFLYIGQLLSINCLLYHQLLKMSPKKDNCSNLRRMTRGLKGVGVKGGLTDIVTTIRWSRIISEQNTEFHHHIENLFILLNFNIIEFKSFIIEFSTFRILEIQFNYMSPHNLCITNKMMMRAKMAFKIELSVWVNRGSWRDICDKCSIKGGLQRFIKNRFTRIEFIIVTSVVKRN